MANIVTLIKDELSIYDLSIKSNQIRHQNVNEESIVLIRACDNFPYNHQISSKKASKYLETISEHLIPYQYILNDEEILCPKYKSNKNTIHFTINGLIYKNSLGLSLKHLYIIIDPLKNHYQDNILVLRPEDTTIENKFEISSDASIIMSTQTYNDLTSAERDELEYYQNIILYDYDIYNSLNFDDNETYNQYVIEDYIVRNALNKLNLPSFRIGEHSFEDDDFEDVKTILQILEDIRDRYNLSSSRTIIQENRELREKLDNIAIKTSITKHLEYLVANSTSSDYIKEKVLEIKDNVYGTENLSELKDFITELGVEKYNELTKEYNKLLEENYESM